MKGLATVLLSQQRMRRWFTGVLLALLVTFLPATGHAQVKSSVHQDLMDLQQEYDAFIEAGGTTDAFASGNTLLRVRNGLVLIDATASGNAGALLAELEALGLQEGVAVGLIVSGWWPIDQIDQLAGLQHLQSAMPAYMTTTGAASAVGGLPERFALGVNYPNPFNPETVIPFAVPEASRVRLAVYDLLGREVAVLLDGPLAPGRYEVTWHAALRPSGLYLARMQAGSFIETQRMTLIK